MTDATAVIAPDLASVRGLQPSDYPPDSSLKEFVSRLKVKVTSAIWPPWLSDVLDQLSELTELPPDWDSYGGRPVTSDSLDRALLVLSLVMRADTEPPWIVPLPDGGVQFEWSSPGLELEISVHGDDGSLEVTDNGEDWELPNENPFGPLGSLRNRIPAAAS